MTSRVTNTAGLDLAIAVWLAHDDYQYDPRPNAISATTLIKPIRQVILAQRIPVVERLTDIADVLSSRMGQALHAAVERSWKEHYVTSLEKLGYPKRVIQAIRVNPSRIEPDTIPVFTEVRSEKEIAGYIVTGQIDLIIDWRLRDVKSTKVWAYVNQKSVDKWKLQGSIYRWLNPEKIQHDEFLVQYLLLDWARALAKRDPNYPSTAAPTRLIQLMSVQETKQWVTERLGLLRHYKDAPEADLPECTEEDLWRTEPVWKYYANVDATGRSTKNFSGDNAELMARQFMAEKGGKGRLDRVPGEVKACHFCPAFDLCTQKDRLIADGSLVLDN